MKKKKQQSVHHQSRADDVADILWQMEVLEANCFDVNNSRYFAQSAVVHVATAKEEMVKAKTNDLTATLTTSVVYHHHHHRHTFGFVVQEMVQMEKAAANWTTMMSLITMTMMLMRRRMRKNKLGKKSLQKDQLSKDTSALMMVLLQWCRRQLI